MFCQRTGWSAKRPVTVCLPLLATTNSPCSAVSLR